MNTSQKLTILLTAAGLLSATAASAQTTYNWNLATGGDWNTAANWNPAAVPSGATNTAIIDDIVGTPHNQTVTYDISTARTIGTLNLLNSAGAGFTDTLQLTSTTANSTTTRFTVSNALTLGSTAGTVEIRLSPLTTASATAVLSINAGLTINAGGLVTLDASALSTGLAIVNANTTMNGGTLSVLGNSAAGGIGVNTGNTNTLTLNSGLITFNATNTSSTGRLQLLGNFTTTGGTITGSANTTGVNQLDMYGATNSIGAGTAFTNAGALQLTLRGNTTGPQSLTSAVDLPNLLVRGGTATNPVNLTMTGTGQNVASIAFNSGAGYLRLGSNVNTPTLPTATITGSTLDLNGFALTSSVATGTFTPTAVFALTSSQGNGTLSVPSFNFGTGATFNTVGANVTVVASASPAGAAITSTAGTATFSPTSTLAFTGNSTAAATNRLILAGSGTNGSTIGNLQVGSGTSTTFLQIGVAPVNLGGNLSVLANSTLDLNTRTMTVAGKVQGTGSITSAAATGGVLTFSSAGGLAPGFASGTGIGSVGALTLSGTAGFQALTLINTSVSNFDLASGTSFDSLVAGANTVTVNGSLVLNLLNGYTPAAGTTWNIFTGLGASSAGTFNSITDGTGDVYSFAINGTNGVLTLNSTAVPEPSTWVASIVALLVMVPARRAFLRSRAR